MCKRNNKIINCVAAEYQLTDKEYNKTPNSPKTHLQIQCNPYQNCSALFGKTESLILKFNEQKRYPFQHMVLVQLDIHLSKVGRPPSPHTIYKNKHTKNQRSKS